MLKFKVEKSLVVGIYVGGENHYDRTVASRGHEYTKKAFKFGNTKKYLSLFIRETEQCKKQW